MVPTPEGSSTHVAFRLGALLRSADPTDTTNDVLVALAAGAAVGRRSLERAAGADLVVDLVAAGVLRADGDMLQLPHALGFAHDLVFCAPDAVPDTAPAGGALYLGPDSAMLTEAALRLAPSGGRAADLGSGTGLHAAVLARRFDTVVATDVSERSTGASRLTLALNGYCPSVVVTDVGASFRPHSFDLVTANPPWVPAPADRAGAPRLFADGGPTGAELPCRFIDAAASLLRPGGVGVVMALDVHRTDGHRPIRAACALLETAGVFTAVIPTPLCRLRPDLEDNMRARQPLLVAAPHVAVVLATTSSTAARRAIAERVELLTQRWSEVRSPQVSGSPSATRA